MTRTPGDPTALPSPARVSEQDLADIARLFCHCAKDDPSENATDVDELRSDLSRPELDQTSITLLKTCNCLLGFGSLLMTCVDGRATANAWLQTALASPPDTERELIDHLERSAADHATRLRSPVELMVNTSNNRDRRVAVLKQLGYHEVRHFVRMGRTLAGLAAQPPSLPHGYHVRSIAGEAEMTYWVEAYNRAFVDHWHFSEMSLDSALHFSRHDPNYRIDGDLICLGPHGDIVGFCQCVIRQNENRITGRHEGWISLLGVTPAHRGRGLGRNLLARGLHWLRTAAMGEARLGVDSSSPTGALALYESAGFSVVGRRTCFAKSIAPDS
jgi:mycothiol synthase